MIKIINESLITDSDMNELKDLISKYNSKIDGYAENIDKLNKQGKIRTFILDCAIDPDECLSNINNFYSKDNNGVYDYNGDIYEFTTNILGYSSLSETYCGFYANNAEWDPMIGNYFDYDYFTKFDLNDELDHKNILELIDSLKNTIMVGNKLNDYVKHFLNESNEKQGSRKLKTHYQESVTQDSNLPEWVQDVLDKVEVELGIRDLEDSLDIELVYYDDDSIEVYASDAKYDIDLGSFEFEVEDHQVLDAEITNIVDEIDAALYGALN